MPNSRCGILMSRLHVPPTFYPGLLFVFLIDILSFLLGRLVRLLCALYVWDTRRRQSIFVPYFVDQAFDEAREFHGRVFAGRAWCALRRGVIWIVEAAGAARVASVSTGCRKTTPSGLGICGRMLRLSHLLFLNRRRDRRGLAVIALRPVRPFARRDRQASCCQSCLRWCSSVAVSESPLAVGAYRRRAGWRETA